MKSLLYSPLLPSLSSLLCRPPLLGPLLDPPSCSCSCCCCCCCCLRAIFFICNAQDQHTDNGLNGAIALSFVIRIVLPCVIWVDYPFNCALAFKINVSMWFQSNCTIRFMISVIGYINVMGGGVGIQDRSNISPLLSGFGTTPARLEPSTRSQLPVSLSPED